MSCRASKPCCNPQQKATSKWKTGRNCNSTSVIWLTNETTHIHVQPPVTSTPCIPFRDQQSFDQTELSIPPPCAPINGLTPLNVQNFSIYSNTSNSTLSLTGPVGNWSGNWPAPYPSTENAANLNYVNRSVYVDTPAFNNSVTFNDTTSGGFITPEAGCYHVETFVNFCIFPYTGPTGSCTSLTDAVGNLSIILTNHVQNLVQPVKIVQAVFDLEPHCESITFSANYNLQRGDILQLAFDTSNNPIGPINYPPPLPHCPGCIIPAYVVCVSHTQATFTVNKLA